jgi:hypothetical protein
LQGPHLQPQDIGLVFVKNPVGAPPATNSLGVLRSESTRNELLQLTKGRLCTRDELLQQIETDRGRPVLLQRLQLIVAAFTRPAAAGDEARHIDVAALRLYGVDDFLTDPVLHRFSAGEIVLLMEPEPELETPKKPKKPKKKPALGKHCLPLLLFTLAYPPPFRQAWSAPSPWQKLAAGSSTPSWPSATAASARLSWSTSASLPRGWRRPSGVPSMPRS